jgi:hypothetical protein
MKGTFSLLVALALLGVIQADAQAQQKIDEILEKLDSAQESEVASAMQLLHQKPDGAEKAVPVLVDHLDSQSPRLIVEAAVALVHIERDYTDQVIKRLLTEPKATSYASRFWVAHPEPSIAHLSEACTEPATESKALKALQLVLQVVRGRPYAKTPEYKTQIKKTSGHLRSVFEDEDSALDSRMTAATMFSELSPKDAFSTLPVVLDGISSSTNYSFAGAAILRPVMDDATPILLSEFNSHAWPSTAATRIAHILATNYTSSYPFLVEAASSPDAAVRHGCALTFGQSAISNYKRETTAPVLKGLLHDEVDGIRVVACRSVVDHYPDLIAEAVPVVFALIENGEDRAQLYAIFDVLSDIGEAAGKHSSDSVLAILAGDGDASLNSRASVAVMRVWPKESSKVFKQVGKLLEASKGYTGETVKVIDAIRTLGEEAAPLKPSLIKSFDRLGGPAGRRLPTQVLSLRYEICRILLGIEPDEIEHLDRMLEIVEAVPFGTRSSQGAAIWAMVERKDDRDKVRVAFLAVMGNRSTYAREIKLDAAAGLLVMFPAEKEKATKLLKQVLNSNRTLVLTALSKAGKHAEPLLADIAVFIRPGSTTELNLVLKIVKNIGSPAEAHLEAIEKIASTHSGSVKTAAEEAAKSIRGE